MVVAYTPSGLRPGDLTAPKGYTAEWLVGRAAAGSTSASPSSGRGNPMRRPPLPLGTPNPEPTLSRERTPFFRGTDPHPTVKVEQHGDGCSPSSHGTVGWGSGPGQRASFVDRIPTQLYKSSGRGTNALRGHSGLLGGDPFHPFRGQRAYQDGP